MSQTLRKIASVADVVFTIAAVAALLISRFNISRPVFWVGVVLGIIALVGFFQLRRISKGRRQELALNIHPDEWIVEQDESGPTNAWLTISENRHERGADVGVRVEQVALKHWDLAEPEIVNGNITIRYAHNNFPLNPRIPLRVYISSRG